MSVFNEFHKAWRARFPGHELPGAWEEDVKANLAKHRARAALLREELEKEQFYVDYLERLLKDVQRHRDAERGSTEEPIANNSSPNWDLIKAMGSEERGRGEGREEADTTPISLVDKFKVSDSETLVSQAIDSALGREHQRAVLGAPQAEEEPTSPPSGNSVRDLARRFAASSPPKTTTRPPAYLRSASAPFGTPVSRYNPQNTQSIDESHFVTVIPISGLREERLGRRPPPPPPPKTFRRPSSTGSDLRPIESKSPSGSPSSSPKFGARLTPSPKCRLIRRPPHPCPEPRIPAQQELPTDALPPSPVASSTSSLASSVRSVSKSSSNASSLEGPKTKASPSPSRGSFLEETEDSLDKLGNISTATPSTGILTDEEPIYDTVAPDETPIVVGGILTNANGSDTVKSGASAASSSEGGLQSSERSTSPPTDCNESGGSHSNYVNIDFFLKKRRRGDGRVASSGLHRSGSVGDDEGGDDSDEDVPLILRSLSSDHDEDDASNGPLDIDSGVYGSSVESTTHIPSAPPTPPASSKKRWKITQNVIEGEDEDEASTEGETIIPILDVDDSTTSCSELNDVMVKQNAADSSGISDVPDVIFPQVEAERLTMYRCIISSIIESETVYLECLDVVLQYMKALKATLTTSQPVISPDDFSTVFYRIPELNAAHRLFLSGLKLTTQQWDPTKGEIGEHFKTLASKLDIYAQFLHNYQRAIECVRRCSSVSEQFSEITRSIKLRSLQGQAQSLEDLLHRPVARVQKNALVLHDLMKYTPESHPDHESIKEALSLTQNFLTHLSIIQTEAMFPSKERPQRHLVRNSFIVEVVDGHRKLRHLFLFNDVLVCAKYKASNRAADKFTFEVKWFISLHDILVVGENIFDPVKEQSPPNLVVLKSQASTVRDQIRRNDSPNEQKSGRMNQSRSNDKRRKKLAELEAQLILASPYLPIRIGKRIGPCHTFLLTSEYERDQWRETIKILQANTPGVGGHALTLLDLQHWITTYRSFLRTNMGSFLLKSGCDESLLLGDLHIVVSSLHGLTSPASMFLCFEVDSYGHFFRKAKTKISNALEPRWNQDFILELEGSQVLRILCYEDHPTEGFLLRGKAHLELSRSWLSSSLGERRVSLHDLVLVLSLKFLPPEATLRKVPSGKSTGLFGASLAMVCRREKRSVPFVVTRCVREVERRGLNEVGVYRVSGLASDINRLKKSFEINPYEAEQLVKEIDIHSVTGLLKLYLREMPEALFTSDLYPRFFDAYSQADAEYKKTTLLKLFTSLPQLNQSLIVYILEHLVKVHQHDQQNKMSLHNLSTVFGPTLLRPALVKNGNPSHAEMLTTSTVDVMAQAGILHFFLKRRAAGEPIQGVLA